MFVLTFNVLQTLFYVLLFILGTEQWMKLQRLVELAGEMGTSNVGGSGVSAVSRAGMQEIYPGMQDYMLMVQF